ncbi:uncharacterized protein MELLADRAFT_58493 [Melampsora larici-populina 98AG31]|uniref:FAD-binding PCMH-type domain-containing protein n=1 Tax=Melampsora larici-populina (strain 98AG31 / pathotype 3-4-7) TaxID=747676 RepID=F4R3P6_MELLP|nr:uncharacterized protein MELLADRAFT_58493 [Melampsora larici-populina 98AG31]EGG13133.1 hypothetical protein MELLADRAFT_58493 [Melampsora larici-populina 98AG31]
MFFHLVFPLILGLDLLVAGQSKHTDQKQRDTYPDILSCLKATDDPILTPDSPEWGESIKPYNPRIAPIPKLILTPNDVSCVQDAMACARLFPGTRLAPLGGGHSYTSFGLGGTDGAIVVNMKSFKQIEMLEPQDGVDIVRVGGGVLVRELTVFLLKNGGLYWPHARCTEVGVVGSAIGGGFGTASRLLGSTLDNVVAVDIILPNGNLTHATATQNADIFFAVLGAGSSYGIIVSIDIKAHKPYSSPVLYTYQWNKPTLEKAVATFNAFQNYGIDQAPPELSLRLNLGFPTGFPDHIIFQGVYYGDRKKFEAIIEPLLSQLSPPDVTNVTAVTFAQSEESLMGPLDGPPAIRPSAVAYTNSLLAFQPLPNNTIQEFMSNLMKRSQEKKSINFRMQQFFDLWGGNGSYSSKMTKEDEDTYGFPHNNALLLFRADGVLNATTAEAWPSDGISFVQSFTKPLFDSQKDPRSYPNYRDSAYTQEQWSSRYYSDEYPKLQQIKAHLDPAGIMSANPQSVQPSTDGA